MARRDIQIRTDDGTDYELELLAGGESGKPWRRVYGTLGEAEQEAAQHMGGDGPLDDWRDISGAHQTSRVTRDDLRDR